jgi:UDP-glucose 4-epimerase
MGLTVAVTGPTGEIGMSTVDAFEKDPAVERVIGMAAAFRSR